MRRIIRIIVKELALYIRATRSLALRQTTDGEIIIWAPGRR